MTMQASEAREILEQVIASGQAMDLECGSVQQVIETARKLHTIRRQLDAYTLVTIVRDSEEMIVEVAPCKVGARPRARIGGLHAVVEAKVAKRPRARKGAETRIAVEA